MTHDLRLVFVFYWKRVFRPIINCINEMLLINCMFYAIITLIVFNVFRIEKLNITFLRYGNRITIYGKCLFLQSVHSKIYIKHLCFAIKRFFNTISISVWWKMWSFKNSYNVTRKFLHRVKTNIIVSFRQNDI